MAEPVQGDKDQLQTDIFERLGHYAAAFLDDVDPKQIEWTTEKMVEHFGTKLVGRLDVWGHRTNTERVRYPADWWQAFKARWFPAWLARRFMVRYTTVTLDAYAWVPGFLPGVGRNEWRAYVIRTE